MGHSADSVNTVAADLAMTGGRQPQEPIRAVLIIFFQLEAVAWPVLYLCGNAAQIRWTPAHL